MFTGSFIGRVGQDAKIVDNEKGQFVSMNLAENYYSKGENKTRWIKVIGFTPRCLNMAKYWTKGRQLEVVGELVDVNIYDDKQGKPQYQMVVNAFRVEFVNTGKKRESQKEDVQPAPVTEADIKSTPEMPFESATNSGEQQEDLPF